MNDKELIMQSALIPPVYVDGFGAFRIVNGILRTVGFVYDGGAQLNLYCSIPGAEDAQIATKRILSEHPANSIHLWGGMALAN